MKKVFLIVVGMLGCLVLWYQKTAGLSTLAKNDPYPIFSTHYPYEYLLYPTKNYLKGLDCYEEETWCDDEGCFKPPHIYGSVSGFYQKANCGRDYDSQIAFLGDLTGKWHMLGMCYGPAVNSLVGTQLGNGKVAIFNYVSPTIGADTTIPEDQILTDTGHHIGFFSVPIKYRKAGIRFEVAVQPWEDFGLLIQGSCADIKQTLTGFKDLIYEPGATTPYNFTTATVDNIERWLMTATAANRIFKQQGIIADSDTQDACDYNKSAFEDLRFSVWGRHIFQVNQCSCDWPEFLFIPFISLEGSIGLSPQTTSTTFLAIPFGNNGHSSIGLVGGFNLDFNETVEFGFYGGFTHFSARDIDNYRLPTHQTQSGVYPFAANIRLQPGNNTEFSLLFHAYRFLEKLSMFAQYVFVNHSEDTITLKTPNSDFLVHQQECLTKFTAHLLTTALNYEISPNFTLGFAVQWPIKQRNAYRSTTVIASLQGEF